jgi:hypothetical protein
MKNAVNWFEIPTTDIKRAAAFYEKVLDSRLRTEMFGGIPHALFPSEGPGVGGALIQDAKRPPSPGGAVVYLNAPNLDASLARVKDAGGEVAVPKTDIGEHGQFAILRDTEGSFVALHAPRMS